eukprot:2362057-Pleurochrysis_carterae.AAC.1
MGRRRRGDHDSAGRPTQSSMSMCPVTKNAIRYGKRNETILISFRTFSLICTLCYAPVSSMGGRPICQSSEARATMASSPPSPPQQTSLYFRPLLYSERLRRLLNRWSPYGVMVTHAQAQASVAIVKDSQFATTEETKTAKRIYEVAVHPVLDQPIPSIYRFGSFFPATLTTSLLLATTHKPALAFAAHLLFQSHSAGMRYCNYSDTSRPLDQNLMMNAFIASSAAACGIGSGAILLYRKFPKLRGVATVVPHLALSCAGAISTYMNNQADLEEGVVVADAYGRICGVSHEAARIGVYRAMWIQAVVIPGCALLAPMAFTRYVIFPRLTASNNFVQLPIAISAAVVCGVVGLTPAMVALVDPQIGVAAASLEAHCTEYAQTLGVAPSDKLYSSRLLY